MNLTVADTILAQIGHKALTMIGASSFAGGGHCVSFRIGRNANRINYIRITVNPMDLYDLEFYKVTRHTIVCAAKCQDVYNDMLCTVIESETGMRTSL